MSSSQPPSPPQPQPQPQPPPPPPTTAAPRRVPPPCWSHDETLALIDAYRDKWYSLRRGNLKAPHWQEVADSVSRLSSPLSSSPKTSVQCRHKIEKLRKRYRSEKQRASASASASASANNRRRPAGPVSSNWVFFKKMEAMERGPDAAADEDDDEDDDDEDEEYEENDDHHHHVRSNGDRLNSRNLQHLQQLQHHQRQHLQQQQQRVMGNGGGGGFRLRIPATGQRSAVVFSSGSSAAAAAAANKAKSFVRVVNQNPSSNSSPNPNFNHPARVFNSGGSWPRSGGGGGGGGVKREAERDDPVAEMVSSIRLLGEGFVRMEQRKIEMAREMEQIRMEMELKRTQMILESQQRIVEAFAKGLSSSSPSPAKKKLNRVPSSPPES